MLHSNFEIFVESALWNINYNICAKIQEVEQNISAEKIRDINEEQEDIKKFLEIIDEEIVKVKKNGGTWKALKTQKILKKSDFIGKRRQQLVDLLNKLEVEKFLAGWKQKLETNKLKKFVAFGKEEKEKWREGIKKTNEYLSFLLFSEGSNFFIEHLEELRNRLGEKILDLTATDYLIKKKKRVEELEDVIGKIIIDPAKDDFSVSEKSAAELKVEVDKGLGGRKITELPAELKKAETYQNVLDKVNASPNKDKILRVDGDIEPNKVKSLLEISTSSSSSSDVTAAGNFYYIKSRLNITDAVGNVDNNLLSNYQEVSNVFSHLGISNWGELKSRLGGPIQINISNSLNFNQFVANHDNLLRQNNRLEDVIKWALGDNSSGGLPTNLTDLQNYFKGFSGGPTVSKLKQQADWYSRIKTEIPGLFQSDGAVNETELETIKKYPTKIKNILGIPDTDSLPSDWKDKLAKKEELDRIRNERDDYKGYKDTHRCPPPCSHSDYDTIKQELNILNNKEKEIVQKLNNSLKLGLNKEEKDLDKVIEEVKKLIDKPPVSDENIKIQLAESQKTIADLQKQLTAVEQQKVIVAEKEKVVEIIKFIERVLPAQSFKRFEEIQSQQVTNFEQLKNVERKLTDSYFTTKEEQKQKLVNNERIFWIYLLMIKLLIIGGLILKLKSKKKSKIS